MKVAINGFGRIGRLVLRRLSSVEGIEVAAINDLADDEVLTYLYRFDSVHGRVDAAFEDGCLVTAGQRIPMTAERNPEDLDWGGKGIDLVIDATGVFTKRAMAQRHLDAGAKKVLITAPATEPDRTIVMGVNDDELSADDRIVSNASCTTNCVAPVAKALNDAFGVENMAFTTIHAYTATQATVDSPSKKLRSGRAAAQNIIPASTGASKALALVVPELQGKVQGMALRVPVPDGSITDMVYRFERPPADLAGLLDALRAQASGRMAGVLSVSDDELVSTDILGDEHSTIVDAGSCMQIDANTFKVLSWYDNEWGYSSRVVDLAQRLLA